MKVILERREERRIAPVNAVQQVLQQQQQVYPVHTQPQIPLPHQQQRQGQARLDYVVHHPPWPQAICQGEEGEGEEDVSDLLVLPPAPPLEEFVVGPESYSTSAAPAPAESSTASSFPTARELTNVLPAAAAVAPPNFAATALVS